MRVGPAGGSWSVEVEVVEVVVEVVMGGMSPCLPPQALGVTLALRENPSRLSWARRATVGIAPIC